MADISKINVNNTEYNIKDSTARSDLSNKMDNANPTGTGSLSLNRMSETTKGDYSVAVGQNCTANGSRALAEGEETIASGRASHAENYATQAKGNRSHADGDHTIANTLAQHVFGAYNVADSNTPTARGGYVEIVGNGTSDNARSNARTLDWSGNEVLAGGLTINGNEAVKAIKTTTVSGSTDASGNIATSLSPSSAFILSAYKTRATGSANTDAVLVNILPMLGGSVFILHLSRLDGTAYASKSDIELVVAYIDI